jgi:hypothetical protein
MLQKQVGNLATQNASQTFYIIDIFEETEIFNIKGSLFFSRIRTIKMALKFFSNLPLAWKSWKTFIKSSLRTSRQAWKNAIEKSSGSYQYSRLSQPPFSNTLSNQLAYTFLMESKESYLASTN